jgi:predicted dehydrogenase
LLQHSTGRVAVVHHLKFSSAMLRVSRWVGGGVIGRLLRFDHKFLTSPATDRMLSRPHWSHTLPGRRWFETLPHALYVLHALVGPLALEHVAVIASTGAPAGAPADEVTVTLAGASTLATLHYSAHCPENRRTIVLAGGNGFIEWDLLSGSARLAHAPDSAWRRALGPILTQAPRDLLAAVPERASAAAHRLLGRTPHARLIHSFARHVTDGGPEPTPLAEVDYVVRTCDAIGHMIERRIQGQAGSPRYLA